MSFKRKASIDASAVISDASNAVEIIPLGAGSEVGRSCIILKYQGKTIMFDCGIHPGYAGHQSLPYLDAVDLATVDVALITHFHLDHCAAVPFLMCKTKFKGRIFMTHPTKAIYHSLLRDFARAAKGSTDEALYDEKDLDASMEKIEVVDFMQTLQVNGIMFTPYRAGHVLGAAMFMVEIAGMRCMYTGDYSRSPDRHMPMAEVPEGVQLDIVIIESTYGTATHPPRSDRESHFLTRVVDTVKQGGKVLLPVVALGRSQELLLLLDEHWSANPELQRYPLYQASGMMRKALTVYQTYVEMMNEDIRRVFQERNPFEFRHVTHLNAKNTHDFDHTGPCVVMATPSGLQSGVSRDVFEMWCEDDKNTVIICDFAVQGTLAREIQSKSTTTILSKTGVRKPLRCAVDVISFSAHADYEQTSGFLDLLRPPHVVLVHGEAEGMGRLAGALRHNAQSKGFARNVFTPRNGQVLQIDHKPRRVVRVVGRLAEKAPAPGQRLHGVLVAPHNPAASTATTGASTDAAASGGGSFVVSTSGAELMHPDDLPAFSKVYQGHVTQRQAIATGATPFSELRLALEVMFEGVEGAGTLPVEAVQSGAEAAVRPSDDGMLQEVQAVRIGNMVTVSYRPPGDEVGSEPCVVVEWRGGRTVDAVADAVVAVLLQAVGEPAEARAADAARRAALQSCDHDAQAHAELQLVAALLRAQFGPATVDETRWAVELQVDGRHVTVDYASGKVECEEDGALVARVDKAVARVLQAMRPCPMAEE